MGLVNNPLMMNTENNCQPQISIDNASQADTNSKNLGVDVAVIWDMDGVIADTAPYHLEA